MDVLSEASMTTGLVERNSPIALVGLLIAVAAVFIPAVPPMLSVGLAILGFVLTMFVGRSIYSLMAGVLVVWSVFGMLLANAATSDAPDLEEPIPVPKGYGFELDPDSTNLEHMYDSQPMPPRRAEFAAVEVINHYVNDLAPAWTVADRDETPGNLRVQLREGDSSRGIGITIHVFTPERGPAILDLRIQALLCGEDGLPPGETCMTAPIRNIVRYPDGGPVPDAGPRIPVREPVPVPPGFGFSLDTGLSYVRMRVYASVPDMSLAEAERVQRAVMRYYRDALDDWIELETRDGYLKVREADSRHGLIVAVRIDEHATGHKVTISIGSIYCPEEYWCHS